MIAESLGMPRDAWRARACADASPRRQIRRPGFRNDEPFLEERRAPCARGCEGTRAAGSVARENDVHRAPGADGTLELATPAPEGAGVRGPRDPRAMFF